MHTISRRCLFLQLIILGVTASIGPDGLMAQPTGDTADSVDFRVVTYNIAAGRHAEVEQIANVLAMLAADVIALQEVASNWEAASESIDQASTLAAMLGMRAFFAPIYSIESGDVSARRFGLAILTRHEIVREQNHELTRLSTQEAAGAPRPMPGFPEVVIRIDSLDVRVFDTHLDYRSDPDLRARQVDEMLAIIGMQDMPTVLAGDLNAMPDAPELRSLFDAFADAGRERNAPTYPATAPDRRIDYILHADSCRADFIPVSPAATSDHLPVVADVVCAAKR